MTAGIPVERPFRLRGRATSMPRPASRFEVLSARLWNVLNEGKPFTPLFTAVVVVVLRVAGLDSWSAGEFAAGAIAVAPLGLLFWHFDFPLRLRWALWAYLAIFLLATWTLPLAAGGVVLALYLGFTVVLWGSVYYHLRIGMPLTNGFRFARLVLENPDPTSGNLLEQVPKVLLLVATFQAAAGSSQPLAIAWTWLFALGVGASALLLHRWFFTWVPPLPQPRLELEAPPAPVRRCRRFIAIVIDGCRADRLLEADTPCIDSLRSAGTDYRQVNTVYPARTVTCFSSMLTGAPPAVHGMRSNFVPSLGVKCDSIFRSLERAGMRGKLVGIAHLIDAFGERDVRSVTAVMHNDEIDDALVATARRVLEEEGPELLVLQLLSVDQTGHARGSYNDEYLRKIEETDAKIASFLAWCREHGYLEDATVLLTADHGQGIGIGGHGHMTPTEVRVPCVLWGAGVKPGTMVDEARFITDIAPTIADYLGIEAPAQSIGRPLCGEDSLPLTERPVVFVIPALNEADNLPGVLHAIDEAAVTNVRMVVVDDGSTDATTEVARAGGTIVVSHAQRRGLGAALRTGLAAARSLEPRAVVYLDADGEYDARETPALLAAIENGADYVVGSRFRGTLAGMTWRRRAANRVFSLALSLLCRRWISDGQSGFRAFSPRALATAEIIHDYNYAQVLTLDLAHKGMRPVEVPISYRRAEGKRSFVGASYAWRVPLGMMREMLRG